MKRQKDEERSNYGTLFTKKNNQLQMTGKAN